MIMLVYCLRKESNIMYGSVLGASITVGSVAMLPNTGSSKLAVALTLTTLTIGASITVVTLTKIIAAKYFA